MKVSKYWKIVEFRKISIKMKNCKPFYESQTTSWLKETIEPLEQKKKFSEKEITNMRFWIIYTLVQVSFFGWLL